MSRDAVGKVSIEQDNKYFRVFIKIGTHKLHSEKMNLDTAFSLANRLESMNIKLEGFWCD